MFIDNGFENENVAFPLRRTFGRCFFFIDKDIIFSKSHSFTLCTFSIRYLECFDIY